MASTEAPARHCQQVAAQGMGWALRMGQEIQVPTCWDWEQQPAMGACSLTKCEAKVDPGSEVPRQLQQARWRSQAQHRPHGALADPMGAPEGRGVFAEPGG